MTPKPKTEDDLGRIRELVRRLRDVEAELQELTGGQIDAVLGDHGQPFLLSEAQQRLRLSEEAQRRTAETQTAILNALPAHIALVDFNGFILSVNEFWRRFATSEGLPDADYGLGKNYLDVCDRACGEWADEAPQVADAIREVLAGRQTSFTLEYPCHSPTEKRWFRLMVSPLDPGRRAGAVVMHVDVTARKLAELKLQASEATMAAAQGIAHFGSWELEFETENGEGKTLHWSDEVFRIAGYEPGEVEVTQELFFDLVHPDDRETVREAVAIALRDRREYSVTHRMVRPGGEERVVHEIARFYFDEATGQPVRMVGTVHDVTEHHQAEVERDRLFNLSLDLLAIASFDGGLLQVNPAWTTCLGWSAEELTRRPMLDFILPEDHAATERARKSIQGGQSLRGFENRYRHKDGSHRWLSWSVHPLPESRLVFAVARDVTSLKESEASLRASTEKQRELALRLEVEHSRLVAAQQVAQIGSWETDLTTLESIWSEETHRIYETDSESFQPSHKASLEFMHPEDRTAVQEVFARSHDSHTTTAVEHRLLLPGGCIKHVAERWQIVRDEHDRPVRAIGTCQDITERKLGERRIKETEERYRALFERSLDAVYLHDLEGRFVDANPAALKLLGYSQEDIRSLDFNSILTNGEDVERARRGMKFQLNGETAEGLAEYELKRKDGSLIWVELAGSLVLENGKPVAIQGIARDITERKETQRQLAEQAALLDKAGDAIVVVDLTGRFSYWNRSASELFGWRSADILGRPAPEVLFGKPEDFDNGRRAVIQANEWLGELELRDSKGNPVVVDSRWSLVCDEENRPTSILMINTDITERRRMESQLLRVQRMESIGTLAGGIAHDLNNILAPILISVELLKMDQANERSSGILDTIETSARRGAEMVKQVLSFSRGVEGERMVVNPAHVAKEVRKIMRETFPKSIETELNHARDLWTMLGDPTQLHQVLLNLCVNARDAMPQGGRITVTLGNVVLDDVYCQMNPSSRPGSYVEIRVTDTGEGIPLDIQDRIFDPFFTTKEIGKGTGLGLSTTAAIIKSHGGFISLYSEPGRGTTFKLFLPRHEEECVPSPEESPTPELGPLEGRGQWILVVDDEDNVREAVKRTLERHRYHVLLASNGAEAVAQYAVHREKIAVVITDMAMPIMDGPATILALTNMNPAVKIIGSSGLASKSQMGAGVGAGIHHFLSKPYTSESVLGTLRELLGDGNGPQEPDSR